MPGFLPANNPVGAAPPDPSIIQNLVRFFHETEVGAGEYDVVKAPAGTAPEDTVYTITAHFQVSSALFFSLGFCAGVASRALQNPLWTATAIYTGH